ncbi:hypothetical protein HPE56_11450 [Maribacter sp. ANRC-HE7]|uniref:Cytochrome C and Quinol oxidase polypeptide I n=1 Tax=Maribacter aquimaris TaxID=2737171 RepID=A0ABR7V0P5_9FLAO|nr:hypothetical protein [Maribacter aquimaris]MBD0778410.1 hypothetical protein [Maribacter aquimaris]
MNLKRHINVALGYFVIAAFFGVVLRSFHSFEIPINYKFVVHGHSHIALMGWVYMGLTTLLYKLFLANKALEVKYRRIFWFTQLTLVGMLVTFPFQGYALFSIVFSTLFLLASYWFVWFFLKHIPAKNIPTNSYQCIKLALWYMVLSSIGPWCLGIIMNTLGAGSIWYRLSIYFYLHFQYNGWMVLALLGLFVYVLERKGMKIPPKTFKLFFWTINVGIMASFFLSTLWIKPTIFLYIIGGAGAMLQIVALTVLFRFGRGDKEVMYLVFNRLQMKIVFTIGVLLALKMFLQLVSAFPYFANLAATITDFTIGYLHLTFLGVVSMGLFLFLDYFKLLRLSVGSFFLFFVGFVLTEGLIFYKGIAAWLGFGIFKGYFGSLALASLLIFVSLVTLLVRKGQGELE